MKVATNNSFIKKEYAEKLATMESLPLFASYHQAHLDGKSLKEWLYSQPLDLLCRYAEASLFPEDESKTEDQEITSDLLATAMLLKAAVTNNKPVEEKEIANEMRFLQLLLTAVSVNKEVQEKTQEDVEIIHINNCTWEEYDKISMKADPRIKFKEENKNG